MVGDRRLTSVVLLTVVLGMASFVPVWLVPLYATGAGVSEAWIGPIWAAANYIVAIASLMSTRMAARKKAAAKRTVVAPKGNKRYVRRNRKGEFNKVVSVGKSLSADKRSKSKTKAKKGQGDRGDR